MPGLKDSGVRRSLESFSFLEEMSQAPGCGCSRSSQPQACLAVPWGAAGRHLIHSELWQRALVLRSGLGSRSQRRAAREAWGASRSCRVVPGLGGDPGHCSSILGLQCPCWEEHGPGLGTPLPWSAASPTCTGRPGQPCPLCVQATMWTACSGSPLPSLAPRRPWLNTWVGALLVAVCGFQGCGSPSGHGL